MTSNQIKYMQHKEEQRHNLATEKEAVRSNLAREYNDKRKNEISYELGKASNDISFNQLAELRRANLENERLKGSQIAVTQEYNTKYLDELQRSNKSREQETRRHDIQTEEYARQQASASLIQASAATSQAGAAYANVNARLAELSSLDRFRNEQIMLNYAQLGETQSHNQASEINAAIENNIRQQQADVAKQNAETAANQVNLGWAQLGEGARHNQQSEQISIRGQTLGLWGSIAGSAARILG